MNQHGINQITKREIEKLFENKVTFPARILSSLRSMSEKLIPNYEDKQVPFVDNPNYSSRKLVPEKLQIKNFIQNTLKSKIIKPNNFSFADLAIWVQSHRTIPDDPNEPFVINDLYYIC